jgi:hypothetical protein
MMARWKAVTWAHLNQVTVEHFRPEEVRETEQNRKKENTSSLVQ